MTVDPITLEVARNEFAAVADEMGAVLRRTAYSPNIKERADCSAAVFVPNGEMLAQAEHIPVHLGSMPASVAAVLQGMDVEPGVQYAVNDPYHGGTHLNDLTLVRPVHLGGVLIGWVANRAHHADVGGEAPGSMPAHAKTLDQEGHVVAPVAAVRNGEWLASFVEPFLAATRTPAERLGDLSAQLGANEVGAHRLSLLADRAGSDTFFRVADALLAYGERRMVSALLALPDGALSFEDVMEWQGGLLPVAVTVTIDGGRLQADFEGTADQIEGNINAVEAVTLSCLYYAVRVATDPTIPANGGCYRPLSLTAPSGSLVNARWPAAVAAGNVETSQRIADVLLGALARAAPDRVPAASAGHHEQHPDRLGRVRLLRDPGRRTGGTAAQARTVGHPHGHDQYQEHADRGVGESLSLPGGPQPAAQGERGSGPIPGRRRHRARDRVSGSGHGFTDGGAPGGSSLGSGRWRTGSVWGGLADPGRASPRPGSPARPPSTSCPATVFWSRLRVAAAGDLRPRFGANLLDIPAC